MSSAHTSTRRVVLNGAWLRHQAKSAIVTYLSPLTGGIGDKIDLAPSKPVTTQDSEQAAQALKASNEQISSIAESLQLYKPLIDSISVLQADIIRIVDNTINHSEGQAVNTANAVSTAHDNGEKDFAAPTFAKKDR